MNFDILNKFNIEFVSSENSFYKIRVDSENLVGLLNSLKNNAQFDFNRLNTIIAIDLGDKFELIYDLHSTETGQMLRVSVFVDRTFSKTASVVDVYKSAYFDECEIFDLFGIIFENNPNLKRLLLPKGWEGFPLRKDYVQTDDKRLAWNS